MSESRTRTPAWTHRLLIPLILLTLCPPAVFIFRYTATALDGSFQALYLLTLNQGFLATLKLILLPVFFGTPTAWKIIALFAAFQLFLMKAVPGKPFSGPITAVLKNSIGKA